MSRVLRPHPLTSELATRLDCTCQCLLLYSISVVAIIDISIVLATKYKRNPPYNYMYMYMKRGLSGTNFSLENNLLTFRLNAPVVNVQTNVAIYSHALLRIHVIGGQRAVRIALPSLISQWTSNR